MTKRESAEKHLPIFPFVATASAVCLLLIYPDTVSEGVRSGLYVAYRSVLPAIIPFMVVADLLVALDLRALDETLGRFIGALFGVSKVGSRAVWIGMLGGFPIGARVCVELLKSNAISKDEARRLLFLSSIASPAFVITGVGFGMLGSIRLGVKLYLTVVISHFLIGIAMRRRSNAGAYPPSRADGIANEFSLTRAVDRAGVASVNVAAYLTFFSVCSALIHRLIPSRIVSTLLVCVLEIGSGAAYTAALRSSLASPILGFCIAFSGVSVYLQIKSHVAEAGIPMQSYLLGKLSSGVLAFILSLLFLP